VEDRHSCLSSSFFRGLIGFVAAENVEDVKGLAGVIELKANPPLPDPQSILRRIDPGKAPHVARSFDGEAIERSQDAVGDIGVKPIEIHRGLRDSLIILFIIGSRREEAEATSISRCRNFCSGVSARTSSIVC